MPRPPVTLENVDRPLVLKPSAFLEEPSMDPIDRRLSLKIAADARESINAIDHIAGHRVRLGDIAAKFFVADVQERRKELFAEQVVHVLDHHVEFLLWEVTALKISEHH